MSNCLFCKIIAGDIPSTKVYEDELVYAFRDINPQAPTHVLVVPKCHVEDVNGITVDNATYHAVIDTAGRITSLFDKRVNRNVLRAPGNDVKYFLDGPQDEDAWNIYKNYKRREVKLYNTTSVSIGENNDLRTVIKVLNF